MSETPSVSKRPRHHATQDAWEWLEEGDGLRANADQRARIAIELEELDDDLFRLDEARKDPTTKIGGPR